MRYLVLMLFLAVAGCSKKEPMVAKSEASPIAMTDNWTKKDLVDALARKGIKVEVTPYTQGQAIGAAETFWLFDGNAEILVELFNSREDAKKTARTTIGGASFVKGKFLFRVDGADNNAAKWKLDQRLLNEIKSALGD
jgi:hypothetical protein